MSKAAGMRRTRKDSGGDGRKDAGRRVGQAFRRTRTGRRPARSSLTPQAIRSSDAPEPVFHRPFRQGNPFAIHRANPRTKHREQSLFLAAQWFAPNLRQMLFIWTSCCLRIQDIPRTGRMVYGKARVRLEPDHGEKNRGNTRNQRHQHPHTAFRAAFRGPIVGRWTSGPGRGRRPEPRSRTHEPRHDWPGGTGRTTSGRVVDWFARIGIAGRIRGGGRSYLVHGPFGPILCPLW